MSTNKESEEIENQIKNGENSLKLKELIFGKYVIEKITWKKDHIKKLIVYDKDNKDSKYEVLAEERINDEDKILENEALKISGLNGIGIPTIKCFGYYKNYTIFITELIGQELDKIELPIKDINYICKIGFHILNIFQFIHEEKHCLHGDIQPKNFAFGTKYFIYLLNFSSSNYLGITRKKLNGNNVEDYTTNQRFASINELNGKFRKKTDDLESLGYMLLFFINGYLPWDSIKKLDENIEKRQNLIKEVKKKIKILSEAKGDNTNSSESKFKLPIVLCLYLDKINTIEKDEEVNYSDLKNIFSDQYKPQIVKTKSENEQNSDKTTKKDETNQSEIIKKYIKKLTNYSEDLKFNLQMFFDIDYINDPEKLKSYKLFKKHSTDLVSVSTKTSINFRCNTTKSTSCLSSSEDNTNNKIRSKKETACCLVY